jgi:hypothetical protein
VGRQLAREQGWKVGDRIVFQSRAFPGEWALTIAGTFEANRGEWAKCQRSGPGGQALFRHGPARETGVLRALGFERAAILAFSSESIALALAGGGFGVALALITPLLDFTAVNVRHHELMMHGEEGLHVERLRAEEHVVLAWQLQPGPAHADRAAHARDLAHLVSVGTRQLARPAALVQDQNTVIRRRRAASRCREACLMRDQGRGARELGPSSDRPIVGSGLDLPDDGAFLGRAFRLAISNSVVGDAQELRSQGKTRP